MARGKSKKPPRKTKADFESKEEALACSSGGGNIGPLAGITAVVILIIAILLRPLAPNASPKPAAIENLTVDIADWTPSDSPASETKVLADPPAESEPIAKGFSIAAFHNIDETPAKKEDLIHYLRYDDGYTVCLRKEDLEFDDFGVWELKQAKLKYLEHIANHAPHWIAESPLSRKATCRILTLTHEEHAGMEKFMNVIKQDNKEEIVNFTLDKQNNASEHRTIVCLSRLVDLMVDQTSTPAFRELWYTWTNEGTTVKEDAEAESVRAIAFGWQNQHDKSTPFHFYVNGPLKTWIRPTSRPGEKGTMPLGKKEKKASLVVRKNPCPVQDSMALI